ncbi:MAG: amidinotransferase, partial [Bacteroidales bacterium]|nr:amidinotransferase [Bacteroidales bacterium]
TEKVLFIELCDHINYKPVYFYSHDANGQEIYHTNVMMCIGERYVIVCLESITDAKERKLVTDSFARTGHQIIDITFEQVKNYAGNMLELKTNDDKSILVMSQSAFDSLTPTQKSELGKYSELLPLPIKTIETIGGGSARCMIAEIFSKPKTV